MSESESLIAVYMDIENAFPEFSGEKLRYVFDRLAGIGSIAVCRGYADWTKLQHKSKEALQWNVTTVHLFTRGGARKNAADIAISVDAMEELYLVPAITTFVIVSGDTDLAPLATRLRERGKEVIGISRRDAASPFLVRACSDFIYLEDLEPAAQKVEVSRDELGEVREVLAKALKERAGPNGWLHAAALKNHIQRQRSGFDEKTHGYKTFTEFLEAFPDIVEVARSSTGIVTARLADTGVPQPVQETSISEDEALPIEEVQPALTEDEARDLLVRAMNSSKKANGEVDLAWLKPTMKRMAPSFSEESLGYRRFIDFIKAQEDLVRLAQISPSQWKVHPLSEHPTKSNGS